MIMPADDPALAVLSGHGRRIRRGAAAGADGRPGAAADPVTGVLELAPRPRPQDDPAALRGRAGDALPRPAPEPQGGRFIASHITIPDGGPVPDYVHHHDVRFQFIYCLRGWVRVVYEDQGPPFVLQAGDCVLQPPGIRHRVLESSAGLEVLEVTCPAEHPTYVDHELALPTTVASTRRDVRRAALRPPPRRRADVGPRGAAAGFEACDTGIGGGTSGVVEVRTVRAVADGASTTPVAPRRRARSVVRRRRVGDAARSTAGPTWSSVATTPWPCRPAWTTPSSAAPATSSSSR